MANKKHEDKNETSQFRAASESTHHQQKGVRSMMPPLQFMKNVVQNQNDKAAPEQGNPELEKWQQDNVAKVKAVKSLDEENKAESLATAKKNRSDREKRRMNAIDKELAVVYKWIEDHGGKKPAWLKPKLEGLEADKKKTLQQIIDSADSKYTAADLRNKIIQSNDQVKTMKTKKKASNEKWHEHDAHFTGSEELMKILVEIKISPAELKALIGQESGDLMLSDKKINEGKYVGIAQIGPDEAVSQGYKKEDRKSPEKSIIMAAKILKNKINAAKIKPGDFSDVKDYKSFAFAAYNKGQGTLLLAMKKAKAMKRNDKVWANLIKGGNSSPMYQALIEKFNAAKAKSMYPEVVSYVERIFKRLP